MPAMTTATETAAPDVADEFPEVVSDPRVPNENGIVAADYAHQVTFVDHYWRNEDDDRDENWPIHVLGTRIMHQLDVELDGDLIPGVKNAKVDFGGSRATIVTLWIDPALCDITAPARHTDGSYSHASINGHLVLPPQKPAWDWAAKRELVVCHFYAQRVVFE
jgi:hypothetical protein